jgi:galactokinase
MPSRSTVRAFGPGRANLIGEHTDYNGGLCLPFAIARGVTVTAHALPSARIEVHALDFEEEDAFQLRDIAPAPGWRAFVRGMAAELARAGHPVRGARLTLTGTVPRGSGLSSSAALEAALALAMLALAGEEDADRLELARLCSRVENEWVGANTGLLDQIASLCCTPGHALRLDCRDFSTRPVPLELADWTLATAPSGAAHTHAESGYNARRSECEEACARLGVAMLSDAQPDDVAGLPDPLRARARHVLTENARVDATVAALRAGDLAEVGALLDAGHASLRDDYAASTPEVEATVARLKHAGAAGARMVGGGFGGSVLALFDGPPPAWIERVEPGPGARLL